MPPQAHVRLRGGCNFFSYPKSHGCGVRDPKVLLHRIENCADQWPSNFFRAARMAASFMRFARSAPENPGVRIATFRRSMVGESGLTRAWILKIASLSFKSGRSKITRRSNRPGRSSAGSKIPAGLLPQDDDLRIRSNPSSSTRFGSRSVRVRRFLRQSCAALATAPHRFHR